MQCDICGREKGNFVNAIIEGSLLNVCETCSKFGAVIEKHEESDDDKPEINASQGFHYTEPAENIVEDFSRIIREARERKKLTHEELSMAIAEKESVVQKIESGSLIPSLKASKKLEQYLGIKLIQKEPIKRHESKEKPVVDFKDKSITIGDLMGVKLDKFKKQTGN